MKPLPFNRPFMTGQELPYIEEAYRNGHLSSNGPFTRRCESWLEKFTGSPRAILVHSATAALEMAAILAGIEPGDEIILPSFTFVSTANAFVLRGGVPVFVDIRPDTLNIDERQVERAVTSRTRAIVPVHYSGVSSEMDALLEIAQRRRLLLIEDAAQSIRCLYRGKVSGSLGHLAAVSFHETKSVLAGEGGALLVNDPRFLERAEVIRDKGTNRKAFLSGQVDKYTWVDLGSSYGPPDYVAAFLMAQLEASEKIVRERMAQWKRYHAGLADLEAMGLLRRPIIPPHCEHGAHLYHILLAKSEWRDPFIRSLGEAGIHATFHYVPLHNSPAGLRFGRSNGPLPVTEDTASRLVRLPIWPGLEDSMDRILEAVHHSLQTQVG